MSVDRMDEEWAFDVLTRVMAGEYLGEDPSLTSARVDEALRIADAAKHEYDRSAYLAAMDELYGPAPDAPLSEQPSV